MGKNSISPHASLSTPQINARFAKAERETARTDLVELAEGVAAVLFHGAEYLEKDDVVTLACSLAGVLRAVAVKTA
jgi:hypothetical protein